MSVTQSVGRQRDFTELTLASEVPNKVKVKAIKHKNIKVKAIKVKVNWSDNKLSNGTKLSGDQTLYRNKSYPVIKVI